MYIPKMGGQIGNQRSADSALRGVLTAVIRQSSKGREQIARELSVHAGQPISKRMLNDWTAESKKPARFPAFLVGPLCAVLSDDSVQRFVMSQRLRQLLALGEAVEPLVQRRGRPRKRHRKAR